MTVTNPNEPLEIHTVPSGTGTASITANLETYAGGLNTFNYKGEINVHWEFDAWPGAIKEHPYDTVPGVINDIFDYFFPSGPGRPSQVGVPTGVRGLWDPNRDNGAGGTSVSYINYIFDSPPTTPHEVTLHYSTELNSFSSFVTPIGLASGDTHFLARFNGLTLPIAPGQTLNFLSYVPGGVQDFDIKQIDLGSYGTSANPMDFIAGIQLVNSGAAGIVMFVPGAPGDYDRNGLVDNADTQFWRQTFGSTVDAFSGADGNGNGIVDAADFVVWRKNAANLIGSGTSLSAVPEPSSLALLMVMVLCGLMAKKPAGTLRVD